jgi:hypothetical protein
MIYRGIETFHVGHVYNDKHHLNGKVKGMAVLKVNADKDYAVAGVQCHWL